MARLSLAVKTPFLLQVSFAKIIDSLEEKCKQSQGIDDPDHLLLAEANQFPELRHGIKSDSFIKEREQLIRELLHSYFPIALTANEIKAIGIPFLPVIFNLTERFQSILNDAGRDYEILIRDFTEQESYVMNCCMILNKIYGMHLDYSRPLFYDIPTKEGIQRHYRILYNIDFLEIHPTEKAIPLKSQDISQLLDSYEDYDLWKSKFPPGSWLLKGFSIITLVDCTVENAVSIFKEKLISVNQTNFKQSLTAIFQSIFGIADIGIGITIYDKEQNKFRLSTHAEQMPSFIQDQSLEDVEAVCMATYQQLIAKRNNYTISDVSKAIGKYPESLLLQQFSNKGINSFILAPIVKDDQLLGLLEVVSSRHGDLHSINALRLNVVMPFLTDKMERMMIETEREIDSLIQHRYTSIHNSVNWKFRAEARNFLLLHNEHSKNELPGIRFDSIHALYGQMDINGSTLMRNRCVIHDLIIQLNAFIDLGEILKIIFGIHSLDEELFIANNIRKNIPGDFKVNTESEVQLLIEVRVCTVLRKIDSPGSTPFVNQFLLDNDRMSGKFYDNRRQYERSVQLINDNLMGMLDNSQVKVQELYPHYFERFKTDGVEHSIYIGASMAPDQNFDQASLSNLKRWQIGIMCDMQVKHHFLASTLPIELGVTALILVLHSTINLRFRMDEKRFDIEGSTGVRYEMIKKRIDKAKIKGKDERIVQPGKLTFVFPDQLSIHEYNEYIVDFQMAGFLLDDLEYFDIEDLQGVSGLVGARVGIAKAR